MWLRALISGGLVLALSAPAIALAVWRSRDRAAKAFASVAAIVALILLDEIALRVPKLAVFGRLEWNWQGKILEIALALLAIVIWRMTPEESAVQRPRPGWLRPAIAAAASILLLPVI